MHSASIKTEAMSNISRQSQKPSLMGIQIYQQKSILARAYQSDYKASFNTIEKYGRENLSDNNQVYAVYTDICHVQAEG